LDAEQCDGHRRQNASSRSCRRHGLVSRDLAIDVMVTLAGVELPLLNQVEAGVRLAAGRREMRRVIFGAVTLLALSGLALSTPSAASTFSVHNQIHAQTVRCTLAAIGHKEVTKDQITACNSSSLRVTHPCPKGSSSVFVVIHGRTYVLRVGHSPDRLAHQYGMGTITQACGIPAAAPATPATTATTALPPPTTTATVPPPPPTTTQPPPTTAATSCYPLSDGGNCYEPGEYCRNSDHGASGRAGDGEAIMCENNNGWRWEPT
jgi:hypothetical protein